MLQSPHKFYSLVRMALHRRLRIYFPILLRFLSLNYHTRINITLAHYLKVCIFLFFVRLLI
jgi:hypothetical protein